MKKLILRKDPNVWRVLAISLLTNLYLWFSSIYRDHYNAIIANGKGLNLWENWARCHIFITLVIPYISAIGLAAAITQCVEPTHIRPHPNLK